jgi:hypothetical protein
MINRPLLQELHAGHRPVSPNELAGPGARFECNAELAGQLNRTTQNDPGTAFGNVDDLTVTLCNAAQEHSRVKVALHTPLSSLLAFEKHRL